MSKMPTLDLGNWSSAQYSPRYLNDPLFNARATHYAEEFENIVLRADLSGSMVRLKDVATITLGAQDYTVDGEVDGESTIFSRSINNLGPMHFKFLNRSIEQWRGFQKFSGRFDYSSPMIRLCLSKRRSMK